MSTLVLTVLFGIAFAYFAAGNSAGVNVNKELEEGNIRLKTTPA